MGHGVKKVALSVSSGGEGQTEGGRQYGVGAETAAPAWRLAQGCSWSYSSCLLPGLVPESNVRDFFPPPMLEGGGRQSKYGIPHLESEYIWYITFTFW